MPKAEALGFPVSSTRANHVGWSYRVSTGVLRLGIACRDELFKQAQSFTVDVAGGVQIAFMMDATDTGPVAIRKGEIGID
jgi:hypothetical protein